MAQVIRSAETGQFATRAAAEADPAHHVAETVNHAPPVLPVREERMSEAMCKWHLGLGETGNAMVLHRFTGPDHGPHHSHPFDCRSYILHGGYREEILRPDGSIETADHHPGDLVSIPHNHVHRIVELFAPECLTLYEVLGPKVQEPGFYRLDGEQMLYRSWCENDWHSIR